LSEKTSRVNLPLRIFSRNLDAINDNIGQQALEINGIGPRNDVQGVVFVQVHGDYGTISVVLSKRSSWIVFWLGKDFLSCRCPFTSQILQPLTISHKHSVGVVRRDGELRGDPPSLHHHQQNTK